MDHENQPRGPIQLCDGLRVITANNPSPMTFKGTNSYLLGRQEVAVIDPGPDDADHIDKLVQAAGGAHKISQIWVTHSHVDHTAGVQRLVEQTGAPVFAFGPSDAGRAPHMHDLAALGQLGGGEGVDHKFRPDNLVKDGDLLEVDGIVATTHWTPGHFCNHLAFETPFGTFTGDTVMGWASSLVSPPDGDLTAFMASLDILEELHAPRFFSGHGAPIDAPNARVDELRTHRLAREAAALAALEAAGGQGASVAQLTPVIYHDVPVQMHPAAARNLLAHLIDLHLRGHIRLSGHHGPHGRYFSA